MADALASANLFLPGLPDFSGYALMAWIIATGAHVLLPLGGANSADAFWTATFLVGPSARMTTRIIWRSFYGRRGLHQTM